MNEIPPILVNRRAILYIFVLDRSHSLAIKPLTFLNCDHFGERQTHPIFQLLLTNYFSLAYLLWSKQTKQVHVEKMLEN